MFIAGLLCAVSICLPYTVVPMRRAMGLATYQWDNDPATHPVRARTARAGWGRMGEGVPLEDAAPAGERLGAPLDADSEGVLVPDGLGPREAEGVVVVEGEAVARAAEGEPLGEAVAVAVAV